MVFFMAHLWLWIFSSGLFTAGRWSPQNGGDCKRNVPQAWHLIQVILCADYWEAFLVIWKGCYVLHRRVFGVVKEFL